MIKAIVTDIEGTTSSLSFVKDVLFPYAREHLGGYVRKNEKELNQILNDVRIVEKNQKMSTEDVINTLVRWIDEDRKATPLKSLQGMIWEAGYKAGDFKGHIYDDAIEALQRWKALGINLYVYSSGSVFAQKLLFSHTPKGDLTPLFAGYFDTTIGPKLETTSYKKIIQAIGFAPENIMFLSDNPGETDAAFTAGMQVVLVDRDGQNKSLKSVMNFNDIITQEKAA